MILQWITNKMWIFQLSEVHHHPLLHHGLFSYVFIRLSLHIFLFTVPEIQTRLSDTYSAPVLCPLSLSATDTPLCSLWEPLRKSTVGFNQKQSLCSSCKQTMWYCYTGYTSDSGWLQSNRERTSSVVFEGKYWSPGPIRSSCALSSSLWFVFMKETCILSTNIYSEFITRDSSTTWTPEFGKQTPALVTPVRQSIMNVLGSHRVSLSQTNAAVCSAFLQLDAATRQSNLSASRRSFSAVRRKKRREPSRVYYDEHSSSESSTWTTCRTTSERRELCRGLHTHRRHQQRVQTGGILCKERAFHSANQTQANFTATSSMFN